MMRMTKCKTAVGLGLALVLVACGGGGGSKSNKDADRPVAAIAATPADGVTTGTEVTFSASGSSSPKGNALNYTWELTAKPTGSVAVLSGTETVTTTVTPDKAGAYTVRLIASDSATTSEAVTLTLSVAESPLPVARITASNGALPNIDMQLDGSASSAPAGGSASGLSYAWTLVTQPEGSTVAFDDATLVKPRFKPVKEGLYKVRLVVSYNDGTNAYESASVEHAIEVLAEAASPTAVAKLVTATPTRGQAVQLDAGESSIPDGSELKYFWRFGTTSGRPYPTSGRPTGSKAVLENPTSATPTFVPDVVGTYTVQLMAWSGKRVSITSVTVRAVKPDGVANTKPVAVVSPTYYSYSFEQEPGIGDSQRVSLGSASYDIDGDTLSREWTLLSYPAGFDPATSFTPGTYAAFQPTHEGQYVAQLKVCETLTAEKLCGDPVTQVYTIRTGANVGPVATIKTSVGSQTSNIGTAALRANTMVGQTVTLDGSQSNGGNLDRVFYDWELVYKPEGSNAKLDETGAAYPKFVADKEGPYLVRLQVTDAYGLASRNSPEILITAKTRNSAPVLRPTISAFTHNATAEQPMLLNGISDIRFGISHGALDPDGDRVDVLVTLVDKPAGLAWPEIRQWTQTFDSTTCGFIGFATCNTSIMDVSGTYSFEVMASDGMSTSEKHVVSLPTSTLADYPTLLLRGQDNWSFMNFPTRSFDTSNASSVVHRAFPVDDPLDSVFGNHSQIWYLWQGETVGERMVYQLRAPVGQSFTIVDLKAESDDTTVPVSFVGLSEGQIIQGGTPVKFSLGVKRYADRTDATATYPKARWSFRVKEKPEFTFAAEFTLAGKWMELPRP